MELDLSQLGLTIAIGAFALVSIRVIILSYKHIVIESYLILRILNAKIRAAREKNPQLLTRYTRLVKRAIKTDVGRADVVNRLVNHFKYLYIIEPQTDSNKFVVGAVFFAIIFSLGVLLEDYSKNISNEPPSFIEVPINNVLTNESRRRLDCFYRIENLRNKKFKISLSSISRDYYHGNTLKNLSDSLHLVNLPRFNFSKNTKIVINQVEYKQLTTCVSRLYYLAKNTVYRNENYFKELEMIASRIHFSRAFTLLNFFLLLIGLLFFLFQVIIEITYFSTFRYHPKSLLKNFLKNLLIISLFYCFMTIGKTVNYSEQTNYNYRVYGYLHSMLIGTVK